jgi:hypothetical protein
MRESWGCIHRAEDEIVTLLFGVPPIMPGFAEGFSLRDEFPLLCRGFGTEISKQESPYGIAPYVSDVQVVEIAKRTTEKCVGRHLRGARIRRFSGPEVRVESYATVRV